MEIVITIIICITILIIVGLICYTKYKLNGTNHYKRANDRIDKILTRINDYSNITNEELKQIKNHIANIFAYLNIR